MTMYTVTITGNDPKELLANAKAIVNQLSKQAKLHEQIENDGRRTPERRDKQSLRMKTYWAGLTQEQRDDHVAKMRAGMRRHYRGEEIVAQ